MVGRWQFWIDRGGTFTDVVARRPDGSLITHKLLSENPGRYDDAAIQGIREVLDVGDSEPIPMDQVEAIKMGTTVATNALLERQGEPTVFVTTKGFADVLRIGYQTRPSLFALDIVLPDLLYERVIEADERLDARGGVLRDLDTAVAERDLRAARADGYTSVAIALLHGYRNPVHEEQLAALATELGFEQISVSHVVSPLMKLISRGDTTVVDAYLSPILRRYVDQVDGNLDRSATAAPTGSTDASDTDQPGDLLFMQSNGGLVDAHRFGGKDAILSGPAGGVVGMARVAEAAGFDRVLGFDMGGTSTDVSHYAGELERTDETPVAGVRLRAPMMLINTVAAGGGSILHFDGSRFRVGPDSAGADPGPAAYRRGGPLTITDCNVMTGKLQSAHFPPVFGPDGDRSLEASVVAEKFEALATEIAEATGSERSAAEVAAGFLEIAVENMANAIKKISVQRGYDVTSYALVSFGGAGAQHACLVADRLGVETVLLHPLAGVLSAYGIGLADSRVVRDHAIESELDAASLDDLDRVFTRLVEDAVADLRSQGIAHDRITTVRRVSLRVAGSDTALVVGAGTLAEIRSAFEERHRSRFGFLADATRPLIVESVQVEAVGAAEQPVIEVDLSTASSDPEAIAHHPVLMDGAWCDTPFYERTGLGLGHAIDGPAVILEPTSTIVIEPGWQATLGAAGDLVLSRVVARHGRTAIGTDADPVQVEIFNNLFMNIAEQMGTVLENTSVSVNIKERLDFSCALFDPTGELVANAPHIPIHLGSMSESIKTIIAENAGTMRPGDAYLLNAPYNGGTHLPDVTLIKPVFDRAGDEILFYTAARGHHADIGGTTPGSAPADSTTVEQEGILIDNVQAVRGGAFLETELRELLASGPYPARNPDHNIADLKAQAAACERGASELLRIIDEAGLDVVHAYMRHVADNAEESVRRVLTRLSDSSFEATTDDGLVIRVAIAVDRDARTATIDFTGTSPQASGNRNAPSAVTNSAVLYVLRCLVDDEIPLNAGCMRPVTLVLPEPSLISPTYPAAVIAGNTETSQLIVDTLMGALGIAAASQGTMNNFVWGNAEIQNYETICGGAGATATADGASAVHTHMTNTRLTDTEVLEWRFPVRVDDFRVRAESGGAGAQRGGDGISRRVRFLDSMTVNVLTSRRVVAPFGMAGGESGRPGRNAVERADGTVEEVPGYATVEVDPDDVFILESPGGGGFGRPAGRPVIGAD